MSGNCWCYIDVDFSQQTINHYANRSHRRIDPVNITEVRIVRMVVYVNDYPIVETADATALYSVAFHKDAVDFAAFGFFGVVAFALWTYRVAQFVSQDESLNMLSPQYCGGALNGQRGQQFFQIVKRIWRMQIENSINGRPRQLMIR